MAERIREGGPPENQERLLAGMGVAIAGESRER